MPNPCRNENADESTVGIENLINTPAIFCLTLSDRLGEIWPLAMKGKVDTDCLFREMPN
jgi:hypothetical protein